MLDVFVEMPGASAAEVEQRASIPMERLLREVPGSSTCIPFRVPGMSMLVVRFYVGTKEEDAIVKAYNKLYSNFDRIPAGVSQPIIKVRSIDDVPIFAVTLWGKNYDSYQLRQIAGELENQLKQIDDVSETKIIGGLPRQVRVTLDTAEAGGVRNDARRGGGATAAGEYARRRGQLLAATTRSSQWKRAVSWAPPQTCSRSSSALSQGKPVYLRDVAASIVDGPAEPEDYVLYANGAALRKTGASGDYPAVTITLAKRKGTNATDITRAAEKKIESLRGYLLPAGSECFDNTQLWRDREGQVRRVAEAPVHRDAVGDAADCAGAGLARVGRRADRDPGDAGADSFYLLSIRLHAEPGDAVRADLLHRHSGR